MVSGRNLPRTIKLYSFDQNIFRISRTWYKFLATLIFKIRKSENLTHPSIYVAVYIVNAIVMLIYTVSGWKVVPN